MDASHPRGLNTTYPPRRSPLVIEGPPAPGAVDNSAAVDGYLPANAADSWRTVRADEQQGAARVGNESGHAPTAECRGGGAGEQDGAHDLGLAGP